MENYILLHIPTGKCCGMVGGIYHSKEHYLTLIDEYKYINVYPDHFKFLDSLYAMDFLSSKKSSPITLQVIKEEFEFVKMNE